MCSTIYFTSTILCIYFTKNTTHSSLKGKEKKIKERTLYNVMTLPHISNYNPQITKHITGSLLIFLPKKRLFNRKKIRI